MPRTITFSHKKLINEKQSINGVYKKYKLLSNAGPRATSNEQRVTCNDRLSPIADRQPVLSGMLNKNVYRKVSTIWYVLYTYQKGGTQ